VRSRLEVKVISKATPTLALDSASEAAKTCRRILSSAAKGSIGPEDFLGFLEGFLIGFLQEAKTNRKRKFKLQ